MCGIFGIVNYKEPSVDLGAAGAATDLLRHRGPDDEGYLAADFRTGERLVLAGPDTPESVARADFVYAPRAGREQAPGGRGWNLVFGHRRLSILDLSAAGHQPMSDGRGEIWLVHNGEIYNFRELRDELAAKGYHFTSDTDTEVIIHAYAEWGPDCVTRFNGMWAFALWDGRRRRLFCSRDRFGEKPFYYRHSDGEFVFASEIKALLGAGRGRPEANVPYLTRFLATSVFDVDDETFFQGINQLRPAHSLLYDREGMRVWRYWDYQADRVAAAYDYADPVVTFRELLADSVRLRLRSDVPVGTCLSGGLDSTTVVGLAAGWERDHRFKTFSSVYPDADFDERRFIDIAAKAYGTEKFSVESQAADFFSVLPRIVWHADEPTAGPGLYSQWHVMDLAAGKVKVLLDGQGGDELLAGYFPYYSYYFVSLIQKFLRTGNPRYLIKTLREQLPVYRMTDTFYLGYIFREVMGRAAGRARAVLFGRRPTAPAELAPGLPMKPLPARPRRFPDALNNVLYYSLTTDSIPALLHYEDRNSMAFGIEARTPFLDHRLCEFCLGLPFERKMNAADTKGLLREAMADLLPKEILERRDKKGYPTPLALWLRGGLRQEALEVLSSAEFAGRGIFNQRAVLDKFAAHVRGERDYSWEIWRWLTTELWFRRFIDESGGGRASAAAGK